MNYLRIPLPLSVLAVAAAAALGSGPVAASEELAKKYKGQADAPAKLAVKVSKGSSGVWGPVPMPPNDKVPEADVKALVEWIMKQ